MLNTSFANQSELLLTSDVTLIQNLSSMFSCASYTVASRAYNK